MERKTLILAIIIGLTLNILKQYYVFTQYYTKAHTSKYENIELASHNLPKRQHVETKNGRQEHLLRAYLK